MPPYVRGYAIVDVGETHQRFARIFTLLEASRRRGQPVGALQVEVQAVYREFNRELRAAAELGARAAQAAMRDRLDQTRLRPETDARPHLKSLLIARALPPRGSVELGAVGVADIAQLEKAIDPDYPQHGTYWRAQEQGTSKHVGREIRGYFHGGGKGPDKPRAAFAGGGTMFHHPEFSPSTIFLGPQGGRGGAGTIMVPLRPRRFIARGADDGYAEWLTAIKAAEAQAATRLARTLPRSPTSRRRRR